MFMVVRKKKKVVKYRGSKTHGGGSMKKRRGAGHRGGRGRAGSGKRGDAKKPRYWKEKASKGFTSKRSWTPTTINVGHLNSMAERLVVNGKMQYAAGGYTIDLATLKIERLLGGGIVDKKLMITVLQATPKAVDKVKKAGGTVTVQQPAPADAADDSADE